MKKVVVSVSVLLLSVGVLFAFLFYCGSAYKTVCALKQYDCEKAIKIYEEIDGGLQSWLLGKILPDALEEINSEFNSNEESYEQIAEIYNTVCSFKEYTGLESYYDLFQRLSDSKQAYKNASSALKGKDYETALLWFEKVIPEDMQYTTAHSELQSTRALYVDMVKEEFYTKVRQEEYSAAWECLSTAYDVVPASTFETLKKRLNQNVYKKVNLLLKNKNDWERVLSSRDVDIICVGIAFSTESSNYFRCIYAPEWMYKSVVNDEFTSYSGPCIDYEIVGDRIEEMGYNNKSFGYSIDWDYSSSEKDKFEKLEQRLGGG